MFLTYSDLLNSLDSGATTKITVYNHHMNESSFEQSCLMPMRGDGRDVYRQEYTPGKSIFVGSCFGRN